IFFTCMILYLWSKNSMRKLMAFVPMLLAAVSAHAQHTYEAIVKDAETGQPLPGVTVIVSGTSLGAVSDLYGQVQLRGIPDGKQAIRFDYLGYASRTDTAVFPFAQNKPVVVLLSPAEGQGGHELEEVTVSATRSSRTIDNIPTRVEDRKSTRLNSSHVKSSYAVFCLKKKKERQAWWEPSTATFKPRYSSS